MGWPTMARDDGIIRDFSGFRIQPNYQHRAAYARFLPSEDLARKIGCVARVRWGHIALGHKLVGSAVSHEV